MPVVTAAITDNTGPEQLTRGDGGFMGLPGGTEPVGFWGVTAARTSGAAQAAIIRGNAVGSIGTMATSQSPAGVVSQGTTEINMTLVTASSVWQVGANDLLFVNRGNAFQGGLGVGNVRVSGANAAAVNFSNFTTAVITPTAGEKYSFVAIKGFPTITQALTPVAVGGNATTEQQFNVTGLRAGELVQVMKPTSQAGLNIAGCRVVAAGVLGITFTNSTVTPITPTAAETYTVFSMGGLDAVNNNILVQAAVGNVNVLSQTSGELAVTATGLATSDTILFASKPTFQAGLGVAGTRVSAAGIAGVTFSNSTTAILTPTSAEIYGMGIYRPNPAAPVTILSATLTPASVPALTTVEQGFTVTGLTTNTPIFVNKPSFTSGIGIMGARVTGANGMVVTFTNSTTGAITPPSEAYLIASFGQNIADVNSTWVYTASPVSQQQSLLDNAIRAAMVGMGQIAGA